MRYNGHMEFTLYRLRQNQDVVGYKKVYLDRSTEYSVDLYGWSTTQIKHNISE